MTRYPKNKKVFIFDMEKKDQQKELDRLFKFLGVKNYNPPKINERPNQSYIDGDRKKIKQSKHPFLRRIFNSIKGKLKFNKKFYYILKRNLKLDYYYQLINHRL